MPRRKTPKLLTRLNLSKGKITECLEVVDIQRNINRTGLTPRQVKARKIHFRLQNITVWDFRDVKTL